MIRFILRKCYELYTKVKVLEIDIFFFRLFPKILIIQYYLFYYYL